MTIEIKAFEANFVIPDSQRPEYEMRPAACVSWAPCPCCGEANVAMHIVNEQGVERVIFLYPEQAAKLHLSLGAVIAEALEHDRKRTGESIN